MWWALIGEIAPRAEEMACEKEMACCVRGCHVYKDIWAVAIIVEVLVCSRELASLVPRPEKGPGISVYACADTPLFCGTSETTVIWSVFHDRTLLKHTGRYILVENDRGQFWENCVWTSRVVRPQ